MGENEQGGMLRTVVVIGLVALIAAVVIFAITGLKGNMRKNTDSAVGTIVTTKKPYSVVNPDVSYENYVPNPSNFSGYGDHPWYLPIIGDVPTGSWREVGITLRPSKNIWVDFDVNTNKKDVELVRDYDDVSKRDLKIYKDGNLVAHSTGNDLKNRINLSADTTYDMVIKYYNNSGFTFVDQHYKYEWANLCALHSGTSDGSGYNLNVTSVEAATYEDKYNK